MISNYSKITYLSDFSIYFKFQEIKNGIAVPKTIVVNMTMKSTVLVITCMAFSEESSFVINAKATEPRIIPAKVIMAISNLLITHLSLPLSLLMKKKNYFRKIKEGKIMLKLRLQKTTNICNKMKLQLHA